MALGDRRKSLTTSSALLTTMQLLVILLCNASTSLSCAPVPNGQEKTVTFTLSDFRIPTQMAYSSNVSAQLAAPLISSTREQAQRQITNHVEQAVHQEIRRQAAIQGLSLADQDTVARQIRVSSTYQPMHCTTVNAAASDLVSSGDGYNCLVSGPVVAGISTLQNKTVVNSTVPAEFTTYPGTIRHNAVGNLVIQHVLEIRGQLRAGWIDVSARNEKINGVLENGEKHIIHFAN
ncbi:hypothetical protein GCK32_014651 [Trichostrongylus colubriformis]|uniref:Uncharacterized protein n=1 Tax=Trichostrongylus colubriformis TaxID=6319 RepID=A0AAN8F4D2_TRICO